MPSPTRPLARPGPACARWLDRTAHPPTSHRRKPPTRRGPQPTTRNTAVPSWAASNMAGQRCGVPTLAQSHPRKALDRPVQVGALSPRRATLKLGSRPKLRSPVTPRPWPARASALSPPRAPTAAVCSVLPTTAPDRSRHRRGRVGASGAKGTALPGAGSHAGGRQSCFQRRGKPAPLQPTGGRAAGGRLLRSAQPSRSASRLPAAAAEPSRASDSGREPGAGRGGGRGQAWRRQPPPPCVPAGASPPSPGPPPSIEDAPRTAFQKRGLPGGSRA